MNDWHPERAKALMTLKDIKRRELASKCNVPMHSLNNVLRKKHHYVDPDLAEKIANALGTTVEYLTGASENSDPRQVA